MYRIDDWFNEGSCWNVESMESQYINISTYQPFLGSSCMRLPVELGSPRKDESTSKPKIKSVFFGVMLDILIF